MVEGKVPPERQDALEKAYRAQIDDGLPEGVVQTYLLRNADDVWRIVTVWRSREDFEAVRLSANGPPAIRMFRSAGVEPALQVFEVIHKASQRGLERL